MLKCHNCGELARAADKFCSQCGENLRAIVPQEQSEPIENADVKTQEAEPARSRHWAERRRQHSVQTASSPRSTEANLSTRKVLISIPLPIRRVTQVLVLVVLCLAFAGVIAGQFLEYVSHDSPFGGFLDRFYLDGEGNLPVWYSSFALLLCSALLATIASATKTNKARYVFHWRVLSVIFLALSIDETAMIHEGTVKLIDTVLLPKLHIQESYLYDTHATLAVTFALIFVLAYARFLLHLPIRTLRLFIIAGTVYFLGAVVLELINDDRVTALWPTIITWSVIMSLEEVLEMLGIVVFIYALMSYLHSLGYVAQARGEDRGVNHR